MAATTNGTDYAEGIRGMKLSRSQWEILDHRLEVPYAIWEAVSAYEGAVDRSSDRIDEVCSLLLTRRVADAVELDAEATRDVLVDAVDGSTWWPRHYQQLSDLQMANLERAGAALARAVGRATGIECEFPTW